MTKIFVNKNAIKPYFSPKWGKTYGVGNVLGIFANFPGNSGKNFIATLLFVIVKQLQLQVATTAALHCTSEAFPTRFFYLCLCSYCPGCLDCPVGSFGNIGRQGSRIKKRIGRALLRPLLAWLDSLPHSLSRRVGDSAFAR